MAPTFNFHFYEGKSSSPARGNVRGTTRELQALTDRRRSRSRCRRREVPPTRWIGSITRSPPPLTDLPGRETRPPPLTGAPAREPSRSVTRLTCDRSTLRKNGWEAITYRVIFRKILPMHWLFWTPHLVIFVHAVLQNN